MRSVQQQLSAGVHNLPDVDFRQPDTGYDWALRFDEARHRLEAMQVTSSHDLGLRGGSRGMSVEFTEKAKPRRCDRSQ